MTLVMIIFMCCLTILSVSGLHPTANNTTSKNSNYSTAVKSSLPAASLPPVLSPQLPYLEVDGKRVTSSPSSSSCTPTDPSTLTSAFSLEVREKTVINVRCVVEGAPVTGVKVINWFVNNQNVTHLSQFLMEYSAPTDKYTSQSLLTINVTKDFHCKLLSCSVEHPAWNQPVVTTAIFDVLCEFLTTCSSFVETSALKPSVSQVKQAPYFAPVDQMQSLETEAERNGFLGS